MNLAQRVAARYLRMLAQDQEVDEQAQQSQSQEDGEESGTFGGAGPFFLPDEHVAGLSVPKGGSCCANCKFGSTGEDGISRCADPNFVAWNGGDDVLPAPADEYCSDWWQPAE